MPPLRVAVIGAGAFGRNHLRVYRELEQSHPDLVQLAALVEPDAERRSTFAALYNIPAFATTSELLRALEPAPSLPKGPASGTWDRTPPDLSSRPEAASFAAAAERPAAPPAAPLIHRALNHQPQTPTNPGVPKPALSLPKGPASGTWVDAASVCVPTIHHAAVAEQLLLAGIDILIEKPFAATLAEADHLITLAKQRNRIVAIGHLERFNPAVTATLAALNQPMFFEAHRLSIFTPRSLDVDVVLDLMIHDLDIVLALTQSPVKEVRAVGLPILSPRTDIANVRVEFDSGCVANFTASRVSTEQVRKLRLFQPHQYLSLDFARQELLTISVDPSILAAISASPNAPPSASIDAPRSASTDIPPFSGYHPERSEGPASETTTTLSSRPGPAFSATAQTLSSRPKAALFAAAVERPAAPSASPPMRGDPIPNPPRTEAPPPHHTAPHHPTAGLTLTHSGIPKGEPLRLELEDFLNAVRTRTEPRVPAEAGRAALALALSINEQIAAHAHRTGLV